MQLNNHLLKIVRNNFKTLLFTLKVIPEFKVIHPDILLKSLDLVSKQLSSIIEKASEIVGIESEFFRISEDPGNELKKMIHTILQILNVTSRLLYEGEYISDQRRDGPQTVNQKPEIWNQGRGQFENQMPALLKLCFEFLKFSKDDLHELEENPREMIEMLKSIQSDIHGNGFRV